jgi:hypothetical protein
MRSLPVLLGAALSAALPCSAAAADYARAAAEAAAADRAGAGYTVYVDITFGMRKKIAAAELNDAHAAFGARGFEPAAVTAHEENGDLQGFFVTYRRRPEAR